MAHNPTTLLSDRELLDETARVAEAARRTTAELLTLLAEVEVRELHLGLGYPSLFQYCLEALHFSEAATYSRITAARLTRRFPIIVTKLADGAITLTTVTLLAGHLTDDNHEGLLEAARHKSRRDVERLVASLDPQPDVPSSVRKLPAPPKVESPTVAPLDLASTIDVPSPLPSRPAVVAPLSPERYLIKITVSCETRDKLDRAKDLLRHTIPNGDPAAIVDRALTVLLKDLERTKLASTPRTRRGAPTASESRHVPAAVRRSVWSRDEGRCAFVGTNGRCAETGFLEFHHVVPFAAGGATDADNLQLRCRSHNAYESRVYFDDAHKRSARPRGREAGQLL